VAFKETFRQEKFVTQRFVKGMYYPLQKATSDLCTYVQVLQANIFVDKFVFIVLIVHCNALSITPLSVTLFPKYRPKICHTIRWSITVSDVLKNAYQDVSIEICFSFFSIELILSNMKLLAACCLSTNKTENAEKGFLPLTKSRHIDVARGGSSLGPGPTDCFLVIVLLAGWPDEFAKKCNPTHFFPN
jgi:hypothetical protein